MADSQFYLSGFGDRMQIMMFSRFFLILLGVLPVSVLAEEPPRPVASVEDNIRAMDVDRDGMVSVTEVRAFLESRHGKGYRYELLEEMERKAGAKSCASPFSQSLY